MSLFSCVDHFRELKGNVVLLIRFKCLQKEPKCWSFVILHCVKLDCSSFIEIINRVECVSNYFSLIGNHFLYPDFIRQYFSVLHCKPLLYRVIMLEAVYTELFIILTVLLKRPCVCVYSTYIYIALCPYQCIYEWKFYLFFFFIVSRIGLTLIKSTWWSILTLYCRSTRRCSRHYSFHLHFFKDSNQN